jgi:hypothetical protein
VVNDNNKQDLVTAQTICCVIYHFASKMYSSNNSTKKQKNVITYNHKQGTISMEKHILFKALNIELLDGGG